jgi:hypothetical protein
MNSIK